MKPLLSVRGLTKRFAGLTAVNQVSFDLAPGEILGVIGPNGSGKTTTFATISGFLPADGGSVEFDGQMITGRRPADIAMLGLSRTFQIVQPFAGLTVLDNIVVGALRGGRVSLAEAREIAAKVARQVGLFEERAKLASSLTIVGRKRLEVAKALATRPKLLLLDEVMAGLRPTEVDSAIELIRQVRADGVTIILVEHLMRAVLALSERLIVLQEGKMIAEGEPREVVRRSAVVEAYFGKSSVH